MNTKSLTIIASVILLVAAMGGFVWLWSTSNKITTGFITPSNLQPVEIETVKSDATTLLSALEKNSDIPIGTPTEKMGRANPFDGL